MVSCFDHMPRGWGAMLGYAPILAIYVLFFYLQYPTSLDSLLPTTDIPRDDSHSNSAGYIVYITCMFLTGIIVLFLAEIIFRFTLIFEEIRHMNTRYDGSFVNVLAACFHIQHKFGTLITVIICGISLLAFERGFPQIVHPFMRAHKLTLGAQLILNSLILYTIGLRGPSSVEKSELGERDTMNVAHGLAWSFYTGYLRIVAPDMGNRIATSTHYEQTLSGKVKMVKKLFILMPESCYAPSSLSDADHRISQEGLLPDFTINRAGNIKRSYRSAVYKLKRDTQTYYIAAEYATPLMSLYEMSEIPESGLDATCRKAQMKIFYNTVKEILKTTDCNNNIVLLPYIDRNVDGRPVAIGDLLANEVDHILRSSQ